MTTENTKVLVAHRLENMQGNPLMLPRPPNGNGVLAFE